MLSSLACVSECARSNRWITLRISASFMFRARAFLRGFCADGGAGQFLRGETLESDALCCELCWRVSIETGLSNAAKLYCVASGIAA
jgi:hypothetical protein